MIMGGRVAVKICPVVVARMMMMMMMMMIAVILLNQPFLLKVRVNTMPRFLFERFMSSYRPIPWGTWDLFNGKTSCDLMYQSSTTHRKEEAESQDDRITEFLDP